MKVIINGVSGRMGQKIESLLKLDMSFSYLSGIDSQEHIGKRNELYSETSLIVDFSNAAGNLQLLKDLEVGGYGEKFVLIGSSGLASDTLRRWQVLTEKKSLAVLIAPNTSVGVYFTNLLAQQVAKFAQTLGFDIEIEETHHKRKIDSPSGTGLYLAENCSKTTGYKIVKGYEGKRQQDEIGLHSMRGGGVFGEHKVRFLAEDEEICISHRAFSRDLFAQGAVTMAKWLVNQKPGFYKTDDVALESVL